MPPWREEYEKLATVVERHQFHPDEEYSYEAIAMMTRTAQAMAMLSDTPMWTAQQPPRSKQFKTISIPA